MTSRTLEPSAQPTRSVARQTLKVLVPLDGSPQSEAILPLLAGLAAAETTLVQVVDVAPIAGDESAARLEARDYLHRVAEGLKDRGPGRITTLVGNGGPAGVIVEIASRIGANLIALTTAGRTGFDRLLLGSVAERVIRTSPAPVLALRAREAPAIGAGGLFDRVLVPLDGSDRAWRAVEALALMGAGPHATLTLLGVVPAWEPAPAMVDPDDVVARVLRREGEHLREKLAGAAERARGLGFRASVEVEIGSPADRIIERARKLDATLIAMSTHGRSGITRWTLGSVTEHVLRATEWPLLICR